MSKLLRHCGSETKVERRQVHLRLKELYRSLFKYKTELKASDLYEKVEWHGDPRCPCGSGKKPDECCFKELRSDRHPKAIFEKYSGSEFESYETEFSQNLMDYSEDMDADKQDYEHGDSDTYKQCSLYVIKRGRNIRNILRPMVC